jgi:prepilin-type N-terminal cleavage/methylation domain-containing protein
MSIRTVGHDTRGFTLIEILVALLIFAIIAIGAIGVLGAANTGGGLLEGLPTGLITGRVAKDVTAASVYAQAVQEFIAARSATVPSATPTLYCVQGSVTCPGTAPAELATWCPGHGTVSAVETTLPGALAGMPTPQAEPYQLSWTNLFVLIEPWMWDTATQQYSASGVGDTIIRVCSVVNWEFNGVPRTLRTDRFIP